MVAGMHRSGTSLLAQALAARGVAIGRPEHLMPASETSNPVGHGEILRVARLNDDVLAAVGAHWAGPIDVADHEIAALADTELGDDGRRVLAEELAGVELVKDPRFCLTLPFWRRLLEDRITLVVPWRHPAEVAGSLSARNRLPEDFGRLLWAVYHHRLARAAVGLERLVVSHRELLDQPEVILDTVLRFTGSTPTGPDTQPSPLDRSLIHHHTDAPVDADLQQLLDALAADRPTAGPDVAESQLLFQVASTLGNDHDRVRAVLTGQPRREPAREAD